MSLNSAEAEPTAASRGAGRGATIALVGATVYCVALMVAAVMVPVYETTSSSSSSGEVTTGSETLVSENGLGAVLVLAVPLLVTLAVWALLARARWRPALPLAWALTGLMAVLNVLALASVGIFVLPVTAALVVACTLQRR